MCRFSSGCCCCCCSSFRCRKVDLGWDRDTDETIHEPWSSSSSSFSGVVRPDETYEGERKEDEPGLESERTSR